MGKKAELFFTVVARRADELSRLRLEALEHCRRAGPPTLRCVIASFVSPYLQMTQHAGPDWLTYGRLIAHVSADQRWRIDALAEAGGGVDLDDTLLDLLEPGVPGR